MTANETTAARARHAAARGAQRLEVLRQRHRAEGHHVGVERRRGDVRARRQRRRQVDVHQDPLGRAPPRRGRAPRGRRGRRTSTRPRDALERGHRHGVPGPGDGAADVDLAQLLPRLGADEGRRPVQVHRRQVRRRTRCASEMRKMGIDVRDPDQPVGTLSGGERQSVAIARAVYFGAKVLILDEPTSALGVKQSGVVLRYVAQARDRGLGVIFITHNPHHAYPVGDRFVILNRGRPMGDLRKGEITPRRADPADGRRRRARRARARDPARPARRAGQAMSAATQATRAGSAGRRAPAHRRRGDRLRLARARPTAARAAHPDAVPRARVRPRARRLRRHRARARRRRGALVRVRARDGRLARRSSTTRRSTSS